MDERLRYYSELQQPPESKFRWKLMREQAENDARLGLNALILKPVVWEDAEWREYLIHYGVTRGNVDG